MEVRLPGMDGLELIERLAERDERVPVVIHSASAGHEGCAMACVADAYVLKSSDPSDLRSAVRRLLAEQPAFASKP